MPAARIYALVCLLLVARAVGWPQPAPVLDDAARTKIVQEAARLLEERYVFPDIGKKCGDHIRAQLAEGAFADLTDPGVFARKLTEELQSVSHDKHMRVSARQMGGAAGRSVDPVVQRHRMTRSMAERNFGIARAEVMEDNVGYLELTGFPPVELTRPTAVAAMKFLENVDALIIDLRRNGGGSPSSIQFITSYFFGTRTHLNSLYWREGNRTEEFWTLDSIEGKRRPDLPLFVLTSGYTFSGGEEFAYNLKTRKRATLIGQTTGGGANPGAFFMLDPPVGMFIPTGRAINPVTGDNWEGKGVEPDVKADSAQALDVAYAQAKVAAEEQRTAEEQRILATMEGLERQLDGAEKLLAVGKSEEAASVVKAALDEGRAGGVMDELGINDLGYRYLQANKHGMALEVFGYNVRAFPDSWNVYDSLGEAYLKKGDKAKAIENYRRSLKLNPDNSGARAALRGMGVTE